RAAEPRRPDEKPPLGQDRPVRVGVGRAPEPVDAGDGMDVTPAGVEVADVRGRDLLLAARVHPRSHREERVGPLRRPCYEMSAQKPAMRVTDQEDLLLPEGVPELVGHREGVLDVRLERERPEAPGPVGLSRATLVPVHDDEAFLERALVPSPRETGERRARASMEEQHHLVAAPPPPDQEPLPRPADIDEPAPLDALGIEDRVRVAQLRLLEGPESPREADCPTGQARAQLE